MERARSDVNRHQRQLQPDSSLPPAVPPKMAGYLDNLDNQGKQQQQQGKTSTEQSNYELPPVYIENNMVSHNSFSKFDNKEKYC